MRLCRHQTPPCHEHRQHASRSTPSLHECAAPMRRQVLLSGDDLVSNRVLASHAARPLLPSSPSPPLLPYGCCCGDDDDDEANRQRCRARQYALFPLASVRSALPGSHESDPSQDDSRECKVLLLLARTRLAASNVCIRPDDDLANRRPRCKWYSNTTHTLLLLESGGRHATRVLSCASGQITGSHEYTIVYQYRLDSTLLGRTHEEIAPTD